MTLAYWMVLVAALLPYLTVVIAKYRPDYDNRAPRAQLEAAHGYRQRAYWAHLNGFEAFPPFAAAVVIAHLGHAGQTTIDALALAFVVLRVVYVACYLGDRPTARSLAWAAAYGCVVALFVAAA
jgi:uncharacterized MAPEG superfamily protein